MTFTDARHSARMTLQDVAEYLDLSLSTVRRYDKSGKAPKAVIECLLMIGGYFPTFSLRKNGFEGWKLRQGFLWSPAGEKFTSGDVLASRLNLELVDSLYRSNLRLRSELESSVVAPVNVIDFTLERKKRGIIP
jgi:transcriptional regulator with XRE-family HTH domain